MYFLLKSRDFPASHVSVQKVYINNNNNNSNNNSSNNNNNINIIINNNNNNDNKAACIKRKLKFGILLIPDEVPIRVG